VLCTDISSECELYYVNLLRAQSAILLLVSFTEVTIVARLMSSNGKLENKSSWTLNREVILLLRPAASQLDPSTRLCTMLVLLGCAGLRRSCRGRL